MEILWIIQIFNKISLYIRKWNCIGGKHIFACNYREIVYLSVSYCLTRHILCGILRHRSLCVERHHTHIEIHIKFLSSNILLELCKIVFVSESFNRFCVWNKVLIVCPVKYTAISQWDIVNTFCFHYYKHIKYLLISWKYFIRMCSAFNSGALNWYRKRNMLFCIDLSAWQNALSYKNFTASRCKTDIACALSCHKSVSYIYFAGICFSDIFCFAVITAAVSNIGNSEARSHSVKCACARISVWTDGWNRITVDYQTDKCVVAWFHSECRNKRRSKFNRTVAVNIV